MLAGAGTHLFAGGSHHVPLSLLESRRHGNGVVALRYARAAEPGNPRGD